MLFLLIIAASGQLLACGLGKNGTLDYCGFGSTLTLYAPLADIPLRSISCGENFFVAAAATGRVYSWGSGRYHQLGHGDIENQSRPKMIEKIAAEDIYQVAAGASHWYMMSFLSSSSLHFLPLSYFSLF